MGSIQLPYGSYAFIDEFGEPNLDIEKSGVGQYFILAAVVVDGSRLDAVRVAAGEIRQRYFQKGRMKSKGIGKNVGRRLSLLRALAELEVLTYFLVVDKASLWKDSGLIYRGSFTKFFHKQVYSALFHSHDNMLVLADPFGGDEFQLGFKKYVEAQTVPKMNLNLFRQSVFEWGDKDDPVLQIADILAGSLGHVLEDGKQELSLKQFEETVDKKRVIYEWWPPYKQQLTSGLDLGRDPHDQRVKEFCFQQAVTFLDKNGAETDDDVKCQVAALKILLEQQRIATGAGFIHKDELAERVRGMLPDVMVKEGRWFQRYVIASLRDDGVIITSNSQGYKLPTCVGDVRTYVRDVRGRVEPMLGRLKTAHKQLKLMTDGALDILEGDDFGVIRALIETVASPSPDE